MPDDNIRVTQEQLAEQEALLNEMEPEQDPGAVNSGSEFVSEPPDLAQQPEADPVEDPNVVLTLDDLEEEVQAVQPRIEQDERERNIREMERRSHERNAEARRLREDAERMMQTANQREAALRQQLSNMDPDDLQEWVQQNPAMSQAGVDPDLMQRLAALEQNWANAEVERAIDRHLNDTPVISELGLESTYREELKQRAFDPKEEVGLHNLSSSIARFAQDKAKEAEALERKVLARALARRKAATRKAVPNGRGPKASAKAKPPQAPADKKLRFDTDQAFTKDALQQSRELLDELLG